MNINEILSKQIFSTIIITLTLNTIYKKGARCCLLAQEVIRDLVDNKSSQESVDKNNVDEFDHLVTNKLFNLLYTDARAKSQI